MALGPRDVEKDYYAALGVAKDADGAEIKKAYRKLARELHPDKNPDDAKAEARFKDVSEAYDVLSDEERRKEYDEMRSLFANGGRPGGGCGSGVAADAVMDHLYRAIIRAVPNVLDASLGIHLFPILIYA